MTEHHENPDPSTPPTGEAGSGSKPTGATALIDSIREALDDLSERATPTVREISARAAELTATAASKAAPYARKAGDATADASGKLAERSSSWAAELRASIHPEGDTPAAAADAAGDAAQSVADAVAEPTVVETPAPEANGTGHAPDPETPAS
jgi:hypothetical protein